jgi:shikimate kinase
VPGNVVLIGFSGTGKSTIGALLAGRLGWDFVDTDQRIVERFGKSIAAIFRDDGEAVFRAAEREEVARACAETRRVISVGGGSIVDPATRDVVSAGNRVVRLDASPETILERLRASPGAEERPMLAGTDPLGRIRSLLAARSGAYAVAHVAIDTQDREPFEIVDEITRCVEGTRPAQQGALPRSPDVRA